MNPFSTNSSSLYAGAEPLDEALADRFGLLVQVPDWQGIGKGDRIKIADPSGDGVISDDKGRLLRSLKTWRATYADLILKCPKVVLDYACAVATSLGVANIRLSPRRVRMLSRSLIAVCVVNNSATDDGLFKQILFASLPHCAWCEDLPKEKIEAAHRAAWELSFSEGDRKWIHEFHLEPSLAKKAEMLLASCPSPDVGSSAVAQMMVSERKDRAAAFAMALYPAAACGRIPNLSAEGTADLGRTAQEVLSVDESICWYEPNRDIEGIHPGVLRTSEYLRSLDGARCERASQLFDYLIVNNIVPEDLETIESELEGCVRAVAKRAVSNPRTRK